MNRMYQVLTKEPLALVPGGPTLEPGRVFDDADLEKLGYMRVNTLILNALWQGWIIEVEGIVAFVKQMDKPRPWWKFWGA